MGERRQELVLAPVGLPRLLVEQRVVDGDRRLDGEVLGGLEVGLGVTAARLRGDEADGAEHALLGGERHGHRRGEAELAQQPQVALGPRRPHQHLVGDDAYQLRLPGAQHHRDAVVGVGIDRVTLERFAHQLGPGRVAMGPGHQLDAVGAEDLHRAPVGELGNGELRDALERGAVVDQLGERLARLVEEPQVDLGVLAIGDIAREAPRMDETPVLPPAVGVDHGVADRAVFGAQPHFLIAHVLAAPQPIEDRGDLILVDVELGYVVADVLRLLVAEQLELGAIGALDDAVGSHPVQAHHRAAEEVVELGFVAANLELHPAALDEVSDLGGEGGDSVRQLPVGMLARAMPEHEDAFVLAFDRERCGERAIRRGQERR